MPAEPPDTRAAEPVRAVRAFAPGRVNLIGEHTDYNGGLALPFAIAEGVTVNAKRRVAEHGAAGATSGELGHLIHAQALDLRESDSFAPGDTERAKGWRAFVRGVAGELLAAGVPVPAAELEIHGEIPRGAGLSSSAALEVALALALLALAGAELQPLALARLCARVESEWVGARTGLLDQLASLCGERDTALCIDFASLATEPVPLCLGKGWRLIVSDSGERRALADSGYNERREECARACELLGIESLSAAARTDAERLPAPLARRLRHVIEENARVRATADALRAGDLARVGALLNASHASLRDLYECSTDAVEATVARLRASGAAGARILGGGFGGSVIALFGPGAEPPADAYEVRPAPGAHLLV